MEALNQLRALRQEILEEAQSHRTAGVPCQSDNRWHQVTYDQWAHALERIERELLQGELTPQNRREQTTDPDQWLGPHLIKHLQPDCQCAVCQVLREYCGEMATPTPD